MRFFKKNYKKYKLVKNENCPDGLFQIKAVKDFFPIKTGQLGGFVQSEDNLSHHGNCWIHDNARVFEGAFVSGDAQIFNNARIYGFAHIHDNARVYDHACVYDHARVCDRSRVYHKAHISGNALIKDQAEIHGTAHVAHSAQVYGKAQVYGDAYVGKQAHISHYISISTGKIHHTVKFLKGSQHTLNFDGDKKHLFIGCERYTIKEWKKNYESIGQTNGYTDEQIKEYYEYIKLAEKILL